MDILKKMFFADKWNIGFTAQTIESFLKEKALLNVEWLNEDTIDYSADPFVIATENGPAIYYEYFNFWTGRGKIYYLSNFDFKTKKTIKGLPARSHQSYPYVFEDRGGLYCIPETSDIEEVGLYKISPDNYLKFEKVHTLLAGAACVDSSVVKYEGKYWLFTSVNRCPGEVLIYYADDLMSEFRPHAQNPVAVPEKGVRGAGHLFMHQGTLYRPTQNTLVRYGGSIIINKISRLTPEEYEFEEMFEIHPVNPYPEGIHNISFANNLIVVDGKRKTFSSLMPFKKLMKNSSSYKNSLRNYLKKWDKNRKEV